MSKMTPQQCRMARSALRWSVQELATQAQLAKNTVLTFEHGGAVRPKNVMLMQAALEAHGIAFTKKGAGVVLAA